MNMKKCERCGRGTDEARPNPFTEVMECPECRDESYQMDLFPDIIAFLPKGGAKID